MTGMKSMIESANAEGRAALIGYLPVGYPSVDASCRAIAAMVAAGVDGEVDVASTTSALESRFRPR